MTPTILNLDALRAPSRKVLFLGGEFELGYIPAGASIPVIEGYNRLLEKQTRDMGEVTPEAEAAYRESHSQEIEDMNIGFVSDFCSFWDPSFTREKIAKEATVPMVDAFFTEIVRALLTNASADQGEGAAGSKKN